MPGAASRLASKVWPVSTDMRPASTSHGVEHGAAVLIEQYGVPHGFADDSQPDALRFQGSCVWTIVAPLNAGVVHEIHLDVTHAPVVHQGRISLAQIFLCSGIGRIERIKLVFVLGDVAQVNRLAAGVVYQPVRVIV